MTAAIYELAETCDYGKQSHIATAEYLEACNLLFEQGILSHSIVDNENSQVLKNMKQGFSYFSEWYDEMVAASKYL